MSCRILDITLAHVNTLINQPPITVMFMPLKPKQWIIVPANVWMMLYVPAYMASTYLASASPALSTSFSPNVSKPQRWNVY